MFIKPLPPAFVTHAGIGTSVDQRPQSNKQPTPSPATPSAHWNNDLDDARTNTESLLDFDHRKSSSLYVDVDDASQPAVEPFARSTDDVDDSHIHALILDVLDDNEKEQRHQNNIKEFSSIKIEKVESLSLHSEANSAYLNLNKFESPKVKRTTDEPEEFPNPILSPQLPSSYSCDPAAAYYKFNPHWQADRRQQDLCAPQNDSTPFHHSVALATPPPTSSIPPNNTRVGGAVAPSRTQRRKQQQQKRCSNVPQAYSVLPKPVVPMILPIIPIVVYQHPHTTQGQEVHPFPPTFATH